MIKIVLYMLYGEIRTLHKKQIYAPVQLLVTLHPHPLAEARTFTVHAEAGSIKHLFKSNYQ